MRYDIPALTQAYQKRASDPDVSAWVSAHAGSGKTHVLTQRVVRLLLSGVAPSRLICLTFTKAAAANMSARVFDMLAGWTLMDDAALAAAIARTGATPPRDLDVARRLFAAAVETPGGLKIQTIHAFCERVLHLFPFEANVPAEFRAAEDLERAELLASALQQTFAAAADDDRLGAALALVADECSEGAFARVLDAAIGHREALEDVEGTIARLPAALGLSRDDDAHSVQRAMMEGDVAWTEWSSIAAVFEQGSTKDKEQAARLVAAAALAPDVACLEAYLGFYFTDRGGLRKRIGTGAVEKAAPGLLDRLMKEGSRLEALRDKLRALACVERSAALLRLAAACLDRYETLKLTRGVLDFDDMIARTRALFTREGAAAWALYKLDNGVDHILVDEAQDTSEAQWAILDALASEFTAGAGARALKRTFFAVGDEKQSIFSFQGASPQSFGLMRKSFEGRVRAAGQVFDPVPLDLSFRSARGVLDAVDLIFTRPEALAGLQSDPTDQPPRHAALKFDIPGMVEIWCPIVGEKAEDPTDWALPLDLPRETSPPVELARTIAAKIARLTHAGSRERVHDSDTGALRAIRPGDVMILVRRRDAFFEAMVRALKSANVPVAGADRLEIASHIAVMDMLAAARAALAPDDDYSLACVLKSPLCGLDDEDLIQLAPLRPASLDAALRASRDARHAEVAARIARWRASVGELGPFDFFSRLLGPEGGRRAFLTRLGAEAGDALDEFMALALEHERSAAPSLATFVHEVESLSLTIKRDMESAGDMVRVMTTHAAKGLEAKIVFLPDTCRLPPSASDAALFEIDAPAGSTLAWSPRKADDAAAVAAARAHARQEVENEYRRLLYVALTRAEERLYICGHHGAQGKQQGCWFDLVADGLADVLNEVPDEHAPDGMVHRFGEPSLGDEREPMAAAVAKPTAPDWLFLPAPNEIEPPPPLRPSSALSGADAPDGREPATALRHSSGVQRGLFVHQLLQSLPSLPAEQRAAAALRYLRAQTPGLHGAAAEDLAHEVVQALDLAEAAPLFGAHSRAEAAIAARILREGGKPIDIAGRIDRLAEVGEEVWIADFKTGARPDETPATYVTQLALYRAGVGALYAGRTVRAFIFWTQAPLLEEMSAAALDDALAEV
jgi:ATP-dependent helicase/nuclease subunit A